MPAREVQRREGLARRRGAARLPEREAEERTQRRLRRPGGHVVDQDLARGLRGRGAEVGAADLELGPRRRVQRPARTSSGEPGAHRRASSIQSLLGDGAGRAG